MAPTGTWNWAVPIGAQQSATFLIQNPDGSPYNIAGATWEYVVRLDALDTSSVPVIKITTTANAQGVLTVTVPTATVGLTLNPAATSGLFFRGLYAHSLWMNPGTTTAILWASGLFTVNPIAQP